MQQLRAFETDLGEVENLGDLEYQVKRFKKILDEVVWTKITDDPDTWPEDGQHFFVSMWLDALGQWSYQVWEKFSRSDFELVFEKFVGDKWRPLCDLDRPPEEPQ